MAQQGPLLASVRRIVEERGVEELIALPTAPLPIRVWLDPEEPGLRIDLQVCASANVSSLTCADVGCG